MDKKCRVLLLSLFLILTLVLPFIVPSGALLDSEKERMLNEIWQNNDSDKTSGFLRWFFPSAKAETAPASLPVDFTPGLKCNPKAFTENGYEDASIKLSLETRAEEGVTWRIATVTIKHSSQLRTATAGSLQSSKVALISSMAQKNNAVIAINANYLSNAPDKTSFEYRMGEKVRAKYNLKKDLLIIDQNGDMKTFIQSDKSLVQAWLDAGHTIVNAFTFGPALVQEGKALQISTEYGYNPNGKEPRMAIGQTGPLSYVLVLAEGRTKDSQGVTHQTLADFMQSLGCQEAFNLDGGNSATMVFNGGYYQEKSKSNERAQSDMIYFATSVDPKSWE